MDPNTTIAAGVVAALVPYLTEAGKEFAKQTGKAAAGKLGGLYQALKTHFDNKPTAKEALEDLESDPDNKDIQAALRHQLAKQMSSDPTLVESMKQLMGEIEHDRGSISFLTQVYGRGKVRKIFNIVSVKTLNA